MSDITDEEKQAMKNELPQEYPYLCPDIKSLSVEGVKINFEKLRFGLEIYLNNPSSSSTISNPQELYTEIWTNVVTRYYDADFY